MSVSHPFAYRAPAWLGALLAVALVTAGCSSSDSDTLVSEAGETTTATDPGAGQTTSSVAESATTAARVEPSGDRLSPATFDGEATTVQGETFDLAGLANKDLVIWFWAPW